MGYPSVSTWLSPFDPPSEVHSPTVRRPDHTTRGSLCACQHRLLLFLIGLKLFTCWLNYSTRPPLVKCFFKKLHFLFCQKGRGFLCAGGATFFKKAAPPLNVSLRGAEKCSLLLFQQEARDIFYRGRRLSHREHLEYMPHPLADLQAAGDIHALHRLIERF